MPDDKPDSATNGTNDEGKTDDQQTQEQDDSQAQTAVANFAEWLKEQTTDVKKLYDDEVAGLKSALSSERQQRKELEGKLRDAAEKAEKGSEAEKLLTEQADTLQGLERQAEFYDDAHSQGVTNLKLAWMAVKNTDAFDRRGNVDWNLMKEQFPELFSKVKVPTGDAGSGTKDTPAGETGMNAFIRAAAGRQ